MSSKSYLYNGEEMDYKITFEVTAENEEKAMEVFWDMIMDKRDYIPPEVTPVKNESHEALTGIKAEGTD